MKKIKLINLLPAIATLLLLIIAASAWIAFQTKRQQELEIDAALKVLQNSRQPVIQVENTLESLYLAENQFREYALNSDRKCFENYRIQMHNLVLHIDTLQKVNHLYSAADTTNKTGKIINERDKEIERFLRLKQLTDSLGIVATVIDSVPFKPQGTNPDMKKFAISKESLTIDTVTTVTGQKKGFFGKLKSLFKDDDATSSKTSKVVVKSQTQSGETSSPTSGGDVASDIIRQSNVYFQKQLKNLLEQQSQLRQSELKLIHMNHQLLDEIKLILKSMKQSAMKSQEQSVKQSSGSIAYSSKMLLKILWLSIVASLLFSLLSFILLLKNRKYQLQIIESRQKALDEAAEKGRFLAYLSHEFRTPLSSVVGFAEQLEKTSLNADQKDYLDGLMSSSEILLTTVNDILDLSKLQAGKMTFLNAPFRPEETARQVMKSFANMAKNKNIALKYTADNSFTTLLGDEIRLKQVMNNLVSNALKYSEKGTVSLAVNVIKNQGSALLQIKVSDTGIGIHPDQIGKIFDEYSRVHKEIASNWIIGTGLGLPVTKQLVEGMNGTIDVKSEIGKGSEFIVKIPCSLAEGKDIKVEVSKIVDEELPAGIRLLIADDTVLNVLLLKSIFKRLNVEVDSAENGDEALNLLDKNTYNMVITDVNMPVMNGLELTRRIRNHSNQLLRNLPVIVLTGSVSQEATERMKVAGVNDCLYKPFQQKAFIEMIRKNLL